MIIALLAPIIEISQLCVVTVTVPFYIFVLFMIVDGQVKRINELNTPFFKLCISSGVIDLSTLSANYFGAMFPKYGLFSNFYLKFDRVYAHVYLYIAWSTGICQATSVSVLATNRLSAMIFAESYHKMWSSRRLWVAIAVQFLPGMLSGCMTFFNPTELVINKYNGIAPKFSNKSITNLFFVSGGIFLFVNCLYLIIAYCYLFYSLHKKNKIANSKFYGKAYWSTAKEKTRQRELRLFLIFSVTVAFQLLILLFSTMTSLALVELTVDEFYLLFNALSDLFASTNPYLLWILSDSLRKHALSRLGFCKNNIMVVNDNIATKTVQSASMMIHLTPR